MTLCEAQKKASRALAEHEFDKRYIPVDLRELMQWIVDQAGREGRREHEHKS